MAPALLALAVWGGCGDPVDLPTATTVSISPDTATLEDVGLTVQLNATVRDQNGRIMRDMEVDWSSSDQSVATVSGIGLVTGRAIGTATVKASAGTVSEEATITVRAGARVALHAIYRAMGGDSWRNNSNWMTDAPLDVWHGVYTDRAGNITSLQLIRNGLTGSVPPEVGELRTVEFLSFSDNGVTGSIPPELGDLGNLKTLSIDSNELTGSIPPELGNLNNLEGLYLSGNDLTGSIPPELGGLGNLWDLDLSRNGLTGSIPPEFENLDGMFDLDLSQNGLTGAIPPEIGRLGSRNPFGPWYLDLSDNQLTGAIPGSLGSHQSLRFLDLSENDLTGSIPFSLASQSSLRELYLSGNELTGSIPPRFGSLPSLGILDLSANELTGPVPGALGNLPTLTDLSISGNPLDGPLPRDLIGLPLGLFHWQETDLCAPTDAEFQEWLDGIRDHSGNGDCESGPRTPPPD